MSDASRTSATLLQRLRKDPADQAAWDEFVERYGRMIFGWCRHWGLQEPDAEDVTQNVMVELVRQMRTFIYDPSGSFRGWLRTVAYRSWWRFADGRRRAAGTVDAACLALLRSDAACEDFLRQLEKECDRELLEKAMELVRLRVQPHTWQAFSLMALDGLPAAEVAGRLSMKPGAVFVARSKVQRMLQDEMRRMDGVDA